MPYTGKTKDNQKTGKTGHKRQDTQISHISGSFISRIEMGEGVIAEAPHVIVSQGIGSCVVVALYDTKLKVGGLAHIALPDSRMRGTVRGSKSQCTGYTMPYQCADTAIAALLEGLGNRGSSRSNIVARMAGGARMFPSYSDTSTGIGEQNIVSIMRLLEKEHIPIMGLDVGGNHGRNVEFCLDSGRIIVTALEKEDKEF